MRNKVIYAADLFCGAGGTTTGLSMAANGKPLKSKRGKTFHAFIQALESLLKEYAWERSRIIVLKNQ